MDFNFLKGKCSASEGERDILFGFKLFMAVTEGRGGKGDPKKS